uniref:Ninja-family protein n=1 Tax=Solanum lycopersicum TaxID=4081 RepID=A0A3Q7FHQ0_SOLLC
MNNNSKYRGDMREIYESNKESTIKFNTEKGKSILLLESNGEKPSNKVTYFYDVLDKGILYSGGEEKRISILCICHGMFFTVAEFMKHGGGKEVDDPMKFIKVVDDA